MIKNQVLFEEKFTVCHFGSDKSASWARQNSRSMLILLFRMFTEGVTKQKVHCIMKTTRRNVKYHDFASTLTAFQYDARSDLDFSDTLSVRMRCKSMLLLCANNYVSFMGFCSQDLQLHNWLVCRTCSMGIHNLIDLISFFCLFQT